MNQKKESILNDNINNFINAFNTLNLAYNNINELSIYKYPCIVERYATRLITHLEDWSTINTDLHYKEHINKRLNNNIKDINTNLKTFIIEQQEITAMMYYTFELLHSAKIL